MLLNLSHGQSKDLELNDLRAGNRNINVGYVACGRIGVKSNCFWGGGHTRSVGGWHGSIGRCDGVDSGLG